MIRVRSLVVLAIITLTISNGAHAQSKKIDSLRLALSSPSHDSVRLQVLTQLVREIMHTFPDSALKHGTVAVSLAKKLGKDKTRGVLLLEMATVFLIKSRYHEASTIFDSVELIGRSIQDPRLEATGLLRNGVALWYVGEFKKAKEKMENALVLFTKAHDRKSVAATHTNIALVYDRIGNYPFALQHQLKALAIRDSLRTDLHDLFVSFTNIGLTHQQLKDYQQSLHYFWQALHLRRDVEKYPFSIATLLTNIGHTHYYLKSYDSALFYQQESLRIREELKNSIGIAACHYRIGLIYLARNDRTGAASKFIRAMALQQSIGDKIGYANSTISLADVYRLDGNFRKAISYASIAHQVSDSIKALPQIRDALQVLTSSYAGTGDYKTAFDMQEKLTAVRDSILNEQKNKEIQNLELQYDLERKEREIRLLHQDSELQRLAYTQQVLIKNVTMGGFAVMAILSLVLVNRFRVKSKANKMLTEKNKIIEQKELSLSKSLDEKEMLLKEIHHRVKNNLQVISSLLNQQSRYIRDDKAVEAIREGQARVKSMALIHQKLYQQEDVADISLYEYMTELADYLVKNYQQRDQEIAVMIDPFALKLDVEIAIPLGLILTEVITNSLKYAFPSAQQGQISIAIQLTDHTMHLSIRDNGIGLPQGFDINASASLGIRLIQTLTRQVGGIVEIKNDNGVVYELNIPMT